MIEAQIVDMLYRTTYDVLKRQVHGLTHEDSLLQPPFRGNCLNWVMGHIVYYRAQRILPLVGEAPLWSGETGAIYQRGAAPLTPENAGDAMRFERLIVDLDRTQECLVAGLKRLRFEDMMRPSDNPQFQLGERLCYLHYHESYHTGQTEQLRQLAGKNDQVLA